MAIKSLTRERRYRSIHPLYSLILLYIEPVTALAGFAAAHFFPAFYLSQTTTTTSSSSTTSTTSPLTTATIPAATHIALRQLANLYLLFALNEAFVLRAASYIQQDKTNSGTTRRRKRRYADVRVWRALLAGLLVADVGHLWSLRLLGSGVYWRAWEWNGMAWGNVGVVYAGVGTRVCFLGGVGLGVCGGDEDGDGDGKEEDEEDEDEEDEDGGKNR